MTARYGALASDDGNREKTPDKMTIVMLVHRTPRGARSWTAITIASPVWGIGSIHGVSFRDTSAWRLMGEA